ncbi:hypothetical protein [Desulfosarcina sp.]|uniref:hypothetical protein n=1 Tax=Desulfosarcina sp. TaxID=2027861 RepID=UPI0035690395
MWWGLVAGIYIPIQIRTGIQNEMKDFETGHTSNDHADISLGNFQRCSKIIATAKSCPNGGSRGTVNIIKALNPDPFFEIRSNIVLMYLFPR